LSFPGPFTDYICPNYLQINTKPKGELHANAAAPREGIFLFIDFGLFASLAPVEKRKLGKFGSVSSAISVCPKKIMLASVSAISRDIRK
jgi:hypothetical protein